MVRTVTYVGFGIIVEEDLFWAKFPEARCVDEDGRRSVNLKVIRKMKIPPVSIIVDPDSEYIFIVAKGYVVNEYHGLNEIPYQEIVQRGQVLIPWFQAHFPSDKPGLYAFSIIDS